ncbi:hypothetical protein AVEN_3898-1 [Araneus ventricosus]|uniref:DDE-1 domain-containing protein n=1 Tax=Araneus ventricosus TaxID=182803 RepID=A0A4Y2J9Z8_ARAVE|nr:hypothetical protein AVEN_3898-1 [Araneus ventricosus]
MNGGVARRAHFPRNKREGMSHESLIMGLFGVRPQVRLCRGGRSSNDHPGVLAGRSWASVSTLLINKSRKNFLHNFIDSEVEENVQTEEIQLASLINQLQNANPMSSTEALQWAAEADDSLVRNEILTDNEIIRTVIAEDDDDDDVTPVNLVKISHSELWWHSTLHYSGLKSKILKLTKICSSDV